MKTDLKTGKNLDAVKYVQQQRVRIYQEIKDMTPDQPIEYFRRKSEEFPKKLSMIQS